MGIERIIKLLALEKGISQLDAFIEVQEYISTQHNTTRTHREMARDYLVQELYKIKKKDEVVENDRSILCQMQTEEEYGK